MAYKSEDEPYQQIGLNLKNLRKNVGLTQGELGKILGVSFQQVQKYETGANRIPALQLYILQQTFHVPFDAFFEKVEPPLPGYRIKPQEALNNRIRTICDNKTAMRVSRMLDILLEKVN